MQVVSAGEYDHLRVLDIGGNCSLYLCVHWARTVELHASCMAHLSRRLRTTPNSYSLCNQCDHYVMYLNGDRIKWEL